MDELNSTSLVNFLGFTVGAALYAILLVVVLRYPVSITPKNEKDAPRPAVDRLLLVTALLGLLWNVINIFELVWRDLLKNPFSPYFTAAAFTALGFLPAVVVGSESRTAQKSAGDNIKKLTVSAYLLSAFASGFHFYEAYLDSVAPSGFALWILTVGYLLILAALFALSRSASVERKSLWIVGLGIFAASSLHLSRPHQEETSSWLIELLAHQASLAFIFVILYQNFRFAFADLFLKRALSLLLLAAVVFGSYVFLGAPLLAMHEHHAQPDTQQIAVILVLWMLTALIYPSLHKTAVWLVDRILLRRADYDEFKKEIAQNLAIQENIGNVLEQIRDRLALVLTARMSSVREIRDEDEAGNQHSLIRFSKNQTEILVPATDLPRHKIVLGDFYGGRQLLSEEIEMLEDVALQTARRIDVLRVTHERCERELREQEFSNLAVEAELRALRAQINPHFLFNALTTIGYLINAAPERALQTLLQLTGLLRGVLRSTGEFQTLGEELKLIRTYLEIEQARFEERLKIEICVPEELLSFQIPSLILQPLVENAVKHGISPKKEGGIIRIEARSDREAFVLRVIDTGVGVDPDKLEAGRANRVGLNNIEQRLNLYFRDAARLTFDSSIDFGTSVEIRVDLNVFEEETFDLPKMRAERQGVFL